MNKIKLILVICMVFSWSIFAEKQKYFLTIINDTKLDINFTDDLIKQWEFLFNNNLYVRKIDYQNYYANSNNVRIEKGNKILLPIFMFEKGIEDSNVFKNVFIKNNIVIKLKNNHFLLKDKYYSEKILYPVKNNTNKKLQKTVKLFVMSHCPFGIKAVDNFISNTNLFKEKGIEFNIYYIADIKQEPKIENNISIDNIQSLHGRGEVIEDIRQLLIKKYYSSKYYDYLYYRNKDVYNDEWLVWIYDYLKMDKKKIEQNIEKEGVKLLMHNLKEANDYDIHISPTYFFNTGRTIILLNSIAKLKRLKVFEDFKQHTIIDDVCK